MDEQYLVSQRQAVEMLKECGLSRRSAYFRLTSLPSRELVGHKVFSRIDVDLLCERITRTATPGASATGGAE